MNYFCLFYLDLLLPSSLSFFNSSPLCLYLAALPSSEIRALAASHVVALSRADSFWSGSVGVGVGVGVGAGGGVGAAVAAVALVVTAALLLAVVLLPAMASIFLFLPIYFFVPELIQCWLLDTSRRQPPSYLFPVEGWQ